MTPYIIVLAWLALIILVIVIMALGGAVCYLIGLQIARYLHRREPARILRGSG